MKNIQLMNIQEQHKAHSKEYEDAAIEVLQSGVYINGNNVKEFEKEFAKSTGSQFAISCGNGTDALVLAMRALGIGIGDEVITVGFTFFATAEAIAAVGAKPVFIDVDEKTYCMNPELIEEKITQYTKAILVVHIYGHPADMDKINMIAKKHSLHVCEDCAQAAGTLYKGKPVGSLSDVGCFSFFPTKNLGCDGDGGMVTTNNEEIARACRSLKVHGSGVDGYETLKKMYEMKGKNMPSNIEKGTDKYHNYLIGYNSRLDEIQAAILRKKLTHLGEFIEGRRYNASFYNDALKNTDYLIPYEADYASHSYYIYALQHKNAKKIMEYLKAHGVQCGTYYPIPLHLQGAFAELGYKKGNLPVTEKLSNESFAIPVYPEIKQDELEYVVSVLLEALKDNE